MEQIEKIKDVVVKIIGSLSTGSGFYHQGLKAIVTNFHVVAGERKVAVQLPNGDKLIGQVLTVNPKKDIALVSVGRPLDLPALTIAVKPLAQQEPVFALGYPYDLPFTITKGIVSSVDYVDREVRYIQTDAAINPGNSGGPLCNQDGQVVGMNTMVLRDAQNIGFALPAETLEEELKMFSEDRITDGYHVRCPSCSGLLAQRVEYCDNCGAKLDADRLFLERPRSPLEQFVEGKLAQIGVDPVLARAGAPEFWVYHRGSALIRIFVYRGAFLFSASPLAKLPRQKLVELFSYMLGDNIAPYRFTMSDDVVHVAYRVHLSDLDDPVQRERIGDELIRMGDRANQLDNMLVERFGCALASQAKKEPA
jgi:serine protease Do